MRFMYDGVSSLAAGIHREVPNAQMIAGYVDGPYMWDTAEWALFSSSTVKVEISVVPASGTGDVLDIENGDATPQEFAEWVTKRKASGYARPSGYCSLSRVPEVRRATGSHVLGVDYDLWVADWTGSPVVIPVPGLPPASFAAKQYLGNFNHNGALMDVSAVYDDRWPHRMAASAAPSGLESTAWEFLDAAWTAEPGLSYVVQVRAADGNITTERVGMTAHFRSSPFAPGPAQWRVQAVGGEWSPWRTA